MKRLRHVLSAVAITLLVCSCGSDDPPGSGTPDGGSGTGDGSWPTTDSDSDGLPDAWEELYGLNKDDPNDRDTDFDGDGLSNIIEFGLATLPNDIDSDDDGLSDGEEDANHDGTIGPNETNPTNADTDGDGLTDGQELGRIVPLTSPKTGIAGTDPATFKPDDNNATLTDPLNTDTDGDGIPDGVEDANFNGRVDTGELDPLDLDTDDDGIADGVEDANQNGTVDTGETNPLNSDSDGDGIPDGVEAGVATPIADPDGQGPIRATNTNIWRPDEDPTTTTDPLNSDSDNDGVLDGDEDWNHNGRYEPPQELNPNLVDSDGDGVPDNGEGVSIVCSESALKRITLHALASADITLGLPESFSEVAVLRQSNGVGVGMMFADPAAGIVGFAISKAPSGGNVVQEKQANRSAINSVANLSTEQDRALITWDGFDAIFTTASANRGGKTATEIAAEMAEALAGAGSLTGALPAGGGSPGTFTVYFETILRASTRAIVLGAIAAAPTNDAAIIALSDVANGTGIAQFGDFTGVGCDGFLTPEGNDVIDMLWVVDNSCSMSDEQDAVANAGDEMVALLSTTQLSWRLALTTTEQTGGSITSDGVNGFTLSTPRTTAETESTAWAAAIDALGTGGSGQERGLVVGVAAANGALPASQTEQRDKFRAGATVIVVHMSDEEDFSVKQAAGGSDNNCPENAGKQTRIDQLINDYLSLGQSPSISGLTTFAIHGIQPNTGGHNFCDFSNGAADCTGQSQHGRAYVDVANATGGGAGSICGNMGQVVQDIIRAGAGIASQIELTQPPISSTIRVVMADESGNFAGQPDIQRSRVDGFDYAFALDVTNNVVNHRIIFYGTARPPSNRELMISYRTWEQGSPNPGGPVCDCPPGQICSPDDGECEIDPTCGSEPCPEGYTCNPQTGVCDPDDPCGGCDPGEVCQEGECVPEDPCDCDPGQICDTTTNPPTCRDL